MTPPCYFSFPCESTPEALSRNVEGLKVVGELLTPIVAVAQSYAKKAGLQIDWNNPTATFSKLAVVTQIPKEFDFRGSPWPVQFHYAGPFYDGKGRETIPFPWES